MKKSEWEKSKVIYWKDELNDDFYSPSCMREQELEELSKLEHKLTKQEKHFCL